MHWIWPPSLPEQTNNEQRHPLWNAAAIIDIAASALEREFGANWPARLPEFPQALRVARATIEDVISSLEAGPLEDRALALAEAKANKP